LRQGGISQTTHRKIFSDGMIHSTVFSRSQVGRDTGFICLKQKSACINKNETGLAEILRNLGGATAEAVRDDNPVDDR
jgi:hypothetical protein